MDQPTRLRRRPLAVFTGSEDRQHAYVALSRGTEVNLAYVFTVSPKLAEPGHQARWLWRTLHATELAGLDPGRVLAEAVGERDLAGARDVPAVIDARLRYRLGTPVPLPAAPWSAQVPQIAGPGRRAYIGQIAALMDARKDRIGEYAAEHTPPRAVTALGPVPAYPLDRLGIKPGVTENAAETSSTGPGGGSSRSVRVLGILVSRRSRP
jgi:hypothetical protein